MSQKTQKVKVVLSVTNCICFDQRVLKMSETISLLNCDITIAGRKKGECCKSDLVPFRTHRFSMIFKRGFLFYSFFNIRLFFFLLFRKFDLLVANDLDTLLPNFLVSRLKRIPLVYDSHEYFTGLPEIQNRPFVKWVWTTVEKCIFPGLAYVITVSEPIASLYEKKYRVRPLVIRNLSKVSDKIVPYARGELGIRPDHLLLVIQGTGINIDKGAEELIDAVMISDSISLIVIGSGDIFAQLKRKVTALNLMDRVKFFPAVPWETLMKFTKAADIGMCLEKDTNLNYRYSLPNKLFDYISAGIPVITGDLPEISRIVIDYKCGVIIRSIDPSEISRAVTMLMRNPGQLIELRKNANIASQELNWETESEKAKSMYVGILNNLQVCRI